MPAITRAQAKSASKSRLEPYTVPARGFPPQQSPRPARSSPPVVREPIEDQRLRTRPKFRWTWTADRKLLVNLLGARLPLSEAACTQLAGLFNGPTSEDIRARVEFLSGQRELTLREDVKAADSTAPAEDAVESQQLAAEEVDPTDLHRSDASLNSSVEVDGGCLPTLQPTVTPASPSPSLSSLSSLSPSPSPFPSPTPSTPSPSPRPDFDQAGSPASNGDCQSSPSSRSSTPTSAGSSTSPSQSPPGSQPILPVDARPLKSILKTCSRGSKACVRFDDSANERWEYEVDELGRHKAAQQTSNRQWVPVENADWELPLLKRERDDDDDDDDGDEGRPRKKHCTAGHRERPGPSKYPRFFPNDRSTYPAPVRTIAAAAASQEWQDSDREIPSDLRRRSVMDYPYTRERRMAFTSPTQFADYGSNTPRAGRYSPWDNYLGPTMTAEEEEDLARLLPGANKYRPTAEELVASGWPGPGDDSPDPAPTSSPPDDEELSASDNESDSVSIHSSDIDEEEFVDRRGRLLPLTPDPGVFAEYWREVREQNERQYQLELEQAGAESDDEDAEWEYFNAFDN